MFPDFNRETCRSRQAAGASVASECFFPGQIPDHIPFNLLQSVLLLIIGYHFLNSLISETVFWFIRKLESFAYCPFCRSRPRTTSVIMSLICSPTSSCLRFSPVSSRAVSCTCFSICLRCSSSAVFEQAGQVVAECCTAPPRNHGVYIAPDPAAGDGARGSMDGRRRQGEPPRHCPDYPGQFRRPLPCSRRAGFPHSCFPAGRQTGLFIPHNPPFPTDSLQSPILIRQWAQPYPGGFSITVKCR